MVYPHYGILGVVKKTKINNTVSGEGAVIGGNGQVEY